jgi:hypothetical protein
MIKMFSRHARTLALTAGFVGMLGLAACGKQEDKSAAAPRRKPQLPASTWSAWNRPMPPSPRKTNRRTWSGSTSTS